MIPRDVRASIAALVLSHALGRSVTSVYDYDKAEHLNISVALDGKTVSGVDISRNAKLSGNLPDIYDHARASYIHLGGERSPYTGYDHHSGTHFVIEMRGETAALYDHDTESWSQFSLS
ncbi:hypothetical protein [Brevundimonas sp.]|uniref:hypothetical protein n=1 Tax=Brevundimonas sp. TaxID=1871086 RepID=UPI002FCA028A